jgi:hypothetical protein
MARYSAFLGRAVEVQYRAGDICLPASGTVVADSGRSIFLEHHFEQLGQLKNFRWEIPYQCVVRIEEVELPPRLLAPSLVALKDSLAPDSQNGRASAARASAGPSLVTANDSKPS